MIQVYDSGAAFITENQTLLDTNPQISAFMVLDAPLLKETGKINYAVKCEKDEKTLLAMKVEPYNLILFGDADCAGELLVFLMREGYEIKNYLSEKMLGDATAHEMKARFDIQYEEALAMEFMEAREVTEPSSPEVEAAGEDDLDEICACMEHFLIDCNLQDKLNREAIRRSIGDFRVIRSDGRIVSMGKAVRALQRGGYLHGCVSRGWRFWIRTGRNCLVGIKRLKKSPANAERRPWTKSYSPPRGKIAIPTNEGITESLILLFRSGCLLSTNEAQP